MADSSEGTLGNTFSLEAIGIMLQQLRIESVALWGECERSNSVTARLVMPLQAREVG